MPSRWVIRMILTSEGRLTAVIIAVGWIYGITRQG
jgi:hypothetical protein